MTDKSEMEIIYEDYLQSEDTVIEIANVKFYKIITKNRLSYGEGTIVICVPKEALSNNTNNVICDEKGNIFNISGPSHFSFRGRIPNWYLETVTVTVHDIHETDEIGTYIALK